MPKWVTARIFSLLPFAEDSARQNVDEKHQQTVADMKLLIVDDNAMIRMTLRRLVTDLADDIRECDDGADALPLYREFLPDLVLMDWHMPRVNGLIATQCIRADFPEARILFVTNDDDAMLRATAVQAGACGYVLKENLLELREWVEGIVPTTAILNP